jgi:hypothetical protein
MRWIDPRRRGYIWFGWDAWMPTRIDEFGQRRDRLPTLAAGTSGY